jgi:hypothetical protein
MSYLHVSSLSARFHYTYGLGALDASIELAIYCKIQGLVRVVPINDFFWNENLVVNFLSSIPTLHSQCPYFVQILSIAWVETPLENNRLCITSHASNEYSAIFQLIFPMN